MASSISLPKGLIINEDLDAGYHPIQSYNKNAIHTDTDNGHDHNSSFRSSSPIPGLLRSASSILSRSMRLPPGSLRASTLTVITGMIGGGTFTFSYGIYKSGMIAGLIYLLLLSSLICYTTHCIVWCAERNNCPSFRALALKLCGTKVAIFIQVCLCLMLWMVCVSYMTLTKNLLASAVSAINTHNALTSKPVLLLLIASFFPTYLALKRRVSSLRYASLFGLIVIVFSMIFVVVKFVDLCPSSDPNDKNPGFDRKCLLQSVSDHSYWINTDLLDHSYTIALFFGGFAAQFTVLPIYFEMQKRSPLRMTKCIASGFGITCFIYIIVALFGFWTFPNLVDAVKDQNLITLYENDDVIMEILQILLALYVMSTIPLYAHAFRNSIKQLFVSNKHGDHEDTGSDSGSDCDSDNDIIRDVINNPHLVYVPVSPRAKKIMETFQKESNDNNNNKNMELPTLYHALITLLFLGSAFGVAAFANNIGQVNSVIASSMLPIVGFIFPAVCAVRTDGASFTMKAFTCLTALISVFNAVMFFYNF
eukprot:18499_1